MLTYELVATRVAALTEASDRITRRAAAAARRLGGYDQGGYKAAQARVDEAMALWLSLPRQFRA